MLRKILLLFTVALVSVRLSAQKEYSTQDVFKEKNIVWYGLDFTHCKFIGPLTVYGKEPSYIVSNFFKDWNIIPAKEQNKYDLKDVFDKEYVYYDIENMIEKNSRYNSDSLVSRNSTYRLNMADIPAMVSSYSGVAKEGIGVAYIVESFNNYTNMASFFVVVFDITTKKILFEENITGMGRGVNMKNFWAGAFFEALEKNHKIYRKWRKLTKVK